MKTKKNKVGAIALAISLFGMVLLLAGIKFHYLQHQGWEFLLAGFEAAVVGGFADWFAVRALFAEIPIPFVKKHTNIIVKSRKKLSNGIVDLVENEWLSKTSIVSKIEKINLAKKILTYAQKHEQSLLEFVNKTLLKIVKTTAFYEYPLPLEKLLKKEMSSIAVAQPLGNWIQQSIEQKKNYVLWETVLNTIEKSVNTPETRKVLEKIVQKQAEKLKLESTFKNIFVTGAQVFGGFDNETVVNKLITAINTFVVEAKQDVNHPIRKKVDAQILEFSNKLICNDADAIANVVAIQEHLVKHLGANNILVSFLKNMQVKLVDALENPNSKLVAFLRKQYQALLENLTTDKQLLMKIDQFLKDTIVRMIDENHHLIANVVSESLANLKDVDLVSQIEDKVGDDLQYIRLNGALVGGFIGVILFAIKYFIF